MSRIDIKTVEHIAHLARLEFDEAAKKEMQDDMSNMLSFIDKLNELDTIGVEPLIYMTDESNVLREDEVKETISQREALLNAPKRDSDYIKAPKVIGK